LHGKKYRVKCLKITQFARIKYYWAKNRGKYHAKISLIVHTIKNMFVKSAQTNGKKNRKEDI